MLGRFAKSLAVAVGGVVLLIVVLRHVSPPSLPSEDDPFGLQYHPVNDMWRGVVEGYRRTQSSHTGPPKGSDPTYSDGIPKTIGQPYTQAIVMGRLSSEDASWVEALDMKAYVYVVDDPTATLHIPMNKGHEAMVYLTYIIEHYDSLEDITIFVHAHRYSYHNNPILDSDAVEMIRHLSNDRVMREGYVNLNCLYTQGCPLPLSDDGFFGASKAHKDGLRDFWDYLFPGRPPPPAMEQPAFGQFAVSKERIQGIPLPRFIYIRDWLLQTDLEDKASGRVYEYSWQLIFRGVASDCVEELACFCDGFGICFEGQEELNVWTAMHEQVRKLDFRLADGTLSTEEQQILSARADTFNREKKDMRQLALLRGLSPQIRAQAAHRDWQQGDGF